MNEKLSPYKLPFGWRAAGEPKQFGSVAIMNSNSRGWKQGKNHNLQMSTKDGERELILRGYSHAETVAQLKGLALDPCNEEFTQDKIQPLRKRTLRLRKAMALSDVALLQRKRKLEQFCKDKLGAALGSALDVSVMGHRTKASELKLSHVSSNSCVLNAADSAKSFDQKKTLESCDSITSLGCENKFQGKKVCLYPLFLDDVIDWRSSAKGLVSLVDSNESVNGSNPSSAEDLNHQEPISLDSPDYPDVLHSSAMYGGIKERHQRPCLSLRISNFIGNRPKRKVIPVGSHFQADIPDWIGPLKKGNHDNKKTCTEDSKWLGTQLWPIQSGTLRSAGRRAVGKGRPESCSCATPGSIECVRRHILEERLLLQCDLGRAFFTWQFDEMGEQVAKSWAVKEQETFEALVKNAQANGENFIKHPFRSFPHKPRKSIINYYLNVFVLRRISLQTRSTLGEDEEDGFGKVEEFRKTSEGRGAVVGPSRSKTRYLRQPC